MKNKQKLYVTVKFPWWVNPYIKTLQLFQGTMLYIGIDCDIDVDKVTKKILNKLSVLPVKGENK